MRCPKCGYNSFDYLSQCKKCGVDLTRTRQELGMLHVKPTNPLLLGALLRNGSKPQSKEEKVLEAGQAFDCFQESSPSPEENTIDSSFLQAQNVVKPPTVSPERPSPTSSPAARPGSTEHDDFSIELSDELADWSFLDEQMDESPALESDNIKSSRVKPGQPGGIDLDSKRQAGKKDDNVIELSEEDLEGLFLELEDTYDEKDKKDKS